MRKILLMLTSALLILAAALVTRPLGMAPAAAAGACAKPRFVTTNPEGTWNNGHYLVANDMWNAGGYNISQRLTACTYHRWHVTVRADNSAHDGAVKTYPNVHKDYINWGTGAQPALRSYSRIRSHFAAWTPGRGVFDEAYDVWLDKLNREVMIWTDNHGQRPAGSKIARNVSLGGHTWDVWATSDNTYLAFVATHHLDHASVDIRRMLDWLIDRGRIGRSARLSQIGFGFEIVSTRAKPVTFGVSKFSISTKRSGR